MSFLRTLLMFVFAFSSIEVKSQVNLSPTGTDPVKVYEPDNKNLFFKKFLKTSFLKNLMDNEICNTAVTAGEWDKSRPGYIKEAKERGLKCGITNTWFNIKKQSTLKKTYDKFNLFGNRNTVTKTYYKLSNLMDNEICNTAVTAGEWDKSRPEYIKEAKERRLNCGVIGVRAINSNNAVSLNVNANKSISNYSDYVICLRSQWKENYNEYLQEAKSRGLDCEVKGVKNVAASKPKITKPSISSSELEKEKQKRKSLEQKIVSLEQEKQKRIEEERKRKELEKKLAALQSEKKKQIKKVKQNEIGSGFYVSKFRHIVTNQHVVNQCKKITVGNSMSTQIPADLIASDERNDLAILQTISMDMASAETQSFIQNLSMQIVPIVSGGLIRIEDVKGGEQVYVAGFPHGNMISDSMRLVAGLVNSTRGFENDITQFETDAVIRKGNSGGPVYDIKGNIVGIAVKRFNVTRSDNYNFAIKGSTVKQFLDSHNILTNLANRTLAMTSTKIYNIASKQTVMVVCHR